MAHLAVVTQYPPRRAAASRLAPHLEVGAHHADAERGAVSAAYVDLPNPSAKCDGQAAEEDDQMAASVSDDERHDVAPEMLAKRYRLYVFV